jgi:hypothetical protein
MEVFNKFTDFLKYFKEKNRMIFLESPIGKPLAKEKQFLIFFK